MKKFNITNRISKKAEMEINRIINNHQYYSKAYHWKPNTSAGCRRSAEKRFIINNPDVSFINGADIITVHMEYSETCKNVYYSLTIKINDDIKDIRVIKKLLEKKSL